MRGHPKLIEQETERGGENGTIRGRNHGWYLTLNRRMPLPWFKHDTVQYGLLKKYKKTKRSLKECLPEVLGRQARGYAQDGQRGLTQEGLEDKEL